MRAATVTAQLTRGFWGLALATGVLAACSAPPGSPGGGGGAGPKPDSSADPQATLAPGVLRLDFEAEPEGRLPPDWIGVRAEMRAKNQTPPSWLYDGTWEVARVGLGAIQGKVLRQTQKQPEPWVSLIRYRGARFGPDGRLPMRYRFEVTQQPVASPYNMPPTGDQGVQPYYLDVDHYLEVVNTPRELLVWYCDGAQPMSPRGWKRLYGRALATGPGDARRVGGIVDVREKRFTLLYDGKPEVTLDVPDMDPARPHFMALRSMGNEVNFDEVEVERLDEKEGKRP